MSHTITSPYWSAQTPQQPVFKSTRQITNRAAISATIRKHAQQDYLANHEIESDPWFEQKTTFEILIDMFWGRRNISGEYRTQKRHRTILCWQAVASIPLFPPLGFLVLLMNTCFGLRPKATRVAFFASCVGACLVAANMLAPESAVTLAALR